MFNGTNDRNITYDDIEKNSIRIQKFYRLHMILKREA